MIKQSKLKPVYIVSRADQRVKSFFPLFLSYWISTLLLCCFITGVSPLHAERNDSPGYLIDLWDTSDSLPGNGVLAIAQTPDGYLWVATSKGLSRFDGLTFEPVSFLQETREGTQNKKKDIFPEVLYVDRGGTMWIGSSAGLTRYDYRTRQFKSYTSKDGMTNDRIRLLYEDLKGNLWISYDVSHVDKFSDGTFIHYETRHGLQGRKINAIVEDAGGRLLFGSREHGISRYSNGLFRPYPVPGLTLEHFIITIYVDKNGDLWHGTSKGLFQVNRSTGSVRTITKRDGLSADYITNVIRDDDGQMWIGTVDGLNRMHPGPNGRFSYETFLKNHVITCFLIDREQSLWVGTYDSGLRRLKKKRFSTVNVGTGHAADMIWSLNVDPVGDIWVGTFSGHLHRCRGEKVVETVSIPGVSGAILAAVWDKNNVQWLGTNGNGVFRIDNNDNNDNNDSGAITHFTTANGLADNFVNSILIDRLGRVWFGTAGGVNRFSSGKMESFQVPGSDSTKVHSTKVHNIYQLPGTGARNDRMLIATRDGIAVMDDSGFIDHPLTNASRGVPVMSIHPDRSGRQDKPVLWIATKGMGLKRWKNDKMTTFSTAEGMTTNTIYQIFEDRRQNLWMTSNHGVLRVSKDELNQVADKKIERVTCTSFGLADGMKSTEFNNYLSRHTVVKSKSGAFWLTTRKGIAVVNTSSIQINKTPPPVVIRGLMADGKDVSFDPVKSSAETLDNPGQVELLFTAPTFLTPGEIAFRYRLEPLEKEWVYLSPEKKRAAVYDRLGGGSYIFKVSAANKDGVWNTVEAALSFTVSIPLYKSPFFIIAMILLITAVVWWLLYLKKKGTKPERTPHSEEDKQPIHQPPRGEPDDDSANKSKRPSLKSAYIDEVVKRLNHLMEEEKIYRDETLSLHSLADKLGVTHHNLSQILNDSLNKSFSDYVNKYRIEEAKMLLRDPKRAKQKIITIAFDVGYNTKAAFYNVFKKHTNMTPTQYRNIHLKGEKR